MLTSYSDDDALFSSIMAGASGYVLKSVADRDLVEACRATMPMAVGSWAMALSARAFNGAPPVAGGI